jgi:hypothetical protein
MSMLLCVFCNEELTETLKMVKTKLPCSWQRKKAAMRPAKLYSTTMQTGISLTTWIIFHAMSQQSACITTL